jgi:hypothetical protein
MQFNPVGYPDLGCSPRLRASVVSLCPSDIGVTSRVSRAPSPSLGHPRLAQTSEHSSQAIPDWRVLERLGLNWRGLGQVLGFLLRLAKS